MKNSINMSQRKQWKMILGRYGMLQQKLIISLRQKDLIWGVMSRPAGGAAAFTEHRQSKSPDLWKL